MIPRSPRPWTAWLLLAVIVGVYLAAAVKLGPYYAFGLTSDRDSILTFYERFGVVPRMAPYDGIWGLLSFLTGLFVHTGPIHLVVNGAFIRLLSPGLESRMDTLSVLTLFVVSGVLGAAAHCWLHPGSTLALVGASGSVAGLVGAQLQLSRLSDRLVVGLPWRPLRLETRLWAVLLAWIGLQALGVVVQIVSESHAVALAPHFAGIAVGVVWGRLWRWLDAEARPAVDIRLTA